MDRFRYKVVTGVNSDELRGGVEELLNAGWDLVGPHEWSGGKYAQTLIYRPKKTISDEDLERKICKAVMPDGKDAYNGAIISFKPSMGILKSDEMVIAGDTRPMIKRLTNLFKEELGLE